MTHDIPPKRMVDLISREAALAIIDPGDGDFHAGNYNGIAALPTVTGYTLTSEADAMVAAALRGATRVAVEAAIDYWEETEKPVEQRKHGGKGLPACVAAEIEGLIPQPAAAALDKLIAEAEARGMEMALKTYRTGSGVDNGNYPLWAYVADYEDAVRKKAEVHRKAASDRAARKEA